MATFADYAIRYGRPPQRPPDAGFHPAGWHAPTHSAAPRPGQKRPPRSILDQLLGMLPQPGAYGSVLSDPQIRAKAQADAMGILGPLLDRENSDYSARLAQGTAAVKSYTGAFADRLRQIPGQVQGLYDRQQGITASLGDALATTQTGANQSGIDSLAAALKGMNAPNAQGTVDQQSALSAGGTRLTKTLSADEMLRLANEGTAQESFAALQPGIAALEGGQTLRGYLSDINNQRASSIADINAQAPSLAQSLFQSYYGANEGRRSDRASAQAARAQLAASWMGSEADRNLNAAIFSVKTKTASDALAQKIQAENDRFQIALANAQTARDRVRVTAQHNSVMEGIAQQNANTGATRAAKAGQKPLTWRSVMDDAKKTASGLSTVGVLGQKTRPPWQQAYNQLYRFLRGKYQHLSPDQLRTATINGLYGAGYAPATKPAAGAKPKATTRNPG